MDIEIKDINQCVKEMTITVPKEEAQKDYQKVIKQFKNYVVVPGYRKGKAPLTMVANMFGDKIKDNYLSEKTQDYYKQALEEKNIEPLFPAEPLEVKWEPNEDYKAVFRYEIGPQVDIEKYTGLEIPVTQIEFKEEMVDEALEEFKMQNTRFDEDISEVDKDCTVILSGKMLEPEKNNYQLPDELKFVEMGNHKLGEEFHNALLGCKKDDVAETTVTLKDGSNHKVKLKVEKIVKAIKPDINEEFAKELGYESLDNLRETFREDINKKIEDKNQKEKEMAVNMALMENNPFDVPPTSVLEFSKKFVEPYAKYYNKPVEELVKEYFPTAMYEVKSYCLVDKLLEKLSFEITEEDEKVMIDKMAKQLNLSVEEYLKRNPDVTKSSEFVEKIKKEKLYDYLYENNTLVLRKPKEENGKDEKKETDKQDS